MTPQCAWWLAGGLVAFGLWFDLGWKQATVGDARRLGVNPSWNQVTRI